MRRWWNGIGLWFIVVSLVSIYGIVRGVERSEQHELRFKSDKLDYDEDKGMVRLMGHVKIWNEDLTMTSPYAEYYTDEQRAVFSGGVKLVGEGTTAVAEKMIVLYAENRAFLIGKVNLVSEKIPGQDKRSALGSPPVVLLCDRLEYRWLEGVGYAEGNVKVRRGDKRGYSDRAVYRRAEQLVVMEGNARFERGSEDWLTAERVRFDLASDRVDADGGVAARTVIQTGKKRASKKDSGPLPGPEIVEPPYRFETIEEVKPILLPGVDN